MENKNFITRLKRLRNRGVSGLAWGGEAAPTTYSHKEVNLDLNDTDLIGEDGKKFIPMKQSIHIRELHQSKSIIELENGKNFHYQYSDLALKAWNRTADKELIYRIEDSEIIPNWNDNDVCIKTGLEASIDELKTYVAAFAELPRLVLNNCKASCSKMQLQILDELYHTHSRFMKFHLLNHTDALLRVHPSYRDGCAKYTKISNALYELGKEITLKDNPFCRWIKSFSSVAELWFCIEIQCCFNTLQAEGILSTEQKESLPKEAENNRNMFQILERPGTLKLLYPEGIPEVSLSPYLALLVTADRLAQQNIFYVKSKRKPKSAYSNFISAYRSYTNHRRKSANLIRLSDVT